MDFIFYVIVFLAIVSSLCVISVKNPVHSVFFLILVFCLSSLTLILLTVDFLSVIFVVVYVGAIAVLFLFVVMMLNIRLSHISESIVRFLPMMFLIGIIFTSEIFYCISINNFYVVEKDWVGFIENFSLLIILSNLIYTHYLHAFLIAGLVLLLAMVGTISLTLKHSLNVKRQEVFSQVSQYVNNSISFYRYK